MAGAAENRSFEITPMLSSGSLILRPFEREDRQALAELADNPKVSRYLRDRFPSPYTQDAADAWITASSFEEPRHNFAIQWEGQLAGGIGLEPFSDVHSRTAEIGYWLGEPYWGRGLATAAIALVAEYGFSALRLIRIQAAIFAENMASARGLEKNGFILEGTMRRHITKHGRTHDALLYAKVKE
jgi:RimJ/RimL family protein N-acetyltransferase